MSAHDKTSTHTKIKHRFRGFLPVVVDLETGGFDAKTDALLEIGAVILGLDDDGKLYRRQTVFAQVQPFPGAKLNKASMEVNKINVESPFRMALPEHEALEKLFKPIRNAVSDSGCTRAILVGHNAHFDLGFLNAAILRADIKRSPFHPFSVLDTVTLAGVLMGQTVLSKALMASGLGHDSREAHSALYDAEKTADLFCQLVNQSSAIYAGFQSQASAQINADDP